MESIASHALSLLRLRKRYAHVIDAITTPCLSEEIPNPHPPSSRRSVSSPFPASRYPVTRPLWTGPMKVSFLTVSTLLRSSTPLSCRSSHRRRRRCLAHFLLAPSDCFFASAETTKQGGSASGRLAPGKGCTLPAACFSRIFCAASSFSRAISLPLLLFPFFCSVERGRKEIPKGQQLCSFCRLRFVSVSCGWDI